MKTIRIKRLWNNLASIRDYEVENAISNRYPIVLLLNDQKMTLTPDKLEKGFKVLGNKKMKSRYNPNQMYSLVDYRWNPDMEPSEKQKELF